MNMLNLPHSKREICTEERRHTVKGLREAGRGRDSCSPGKLSVPRGHQQLLAVALPWDRRLKDDDNGIVERVF